MPSSSVIRYSPPWSRTSGLLQVTPAYQPEEEFARANQGPAKAQQALVNAIRQSMGRDLGELPVWMGGSLARPENWP